MTSRIIVLIMPLLLIGCGTTDVYLTESYNGTNLVNSANKGGNIFAVSNNDDLELVVSRLNADAEYHKLKRRGFLTFFIEVSNTAKTNIIFTPVSDLTVNLVNLRTDESTNLPFEVGKYATRTFKQRLKSNNIFNQEYASKLSGAYRASNPDSISATGQDASWMLSEQNNLPSGSSVYGFVLVNVENLYDLEGRTRLDINLTSYDSPLSTQYVIVCRKYRGIDSKKC